ncbi:hypothetical protein [Vibrio phage Va_90-11-286_p16]|nr:hypothetical protein [Vibrio phage Va_90-11-286_p16]
MKYVFTVQWVSLGVIALSHLNWALCNSGKFRVSIFWISPAIRFVLSANEHFYPQIRGSLKP